MNGIKLQAKVYAGQGKAGACIGQPFTIYRPSSATSVIASGNNQGSIPAHFTANGGYKAPNSYGKATWQAMLDGSKVNVGDYLVGADGTDYFIAAKQPLLPILAVGCNRVLSITQGGTSPVAVGWPASVLIESTRGNMPLTDIAGDPATPHWWVLMPAVAGITPNVADLVTDDLLRSYFVTAAELTDLGWRISMQESTQLSPAVIKHYQTIIELIGKIITLRQVITTPASTAKLTTAGIGATSITITGILTPFSTLQAGDQFTNIGNTHTITNSTPVTVVGGSATVTFTPALTTATTNGQSTTITRSADYSVKCLIGDYSHSLIGGTTIGIADLRVVLSTKTTGGAALPVPQTTDKLVIDGVPRAVLSVRAEYAGDTVAVFECQAKG